MSSMARGDELHGQQARPPWPPGRAPWHTEVSSVARGDELHGRQNQAPWPEVQLPVLVDTGLAHYDALFHTKSAAARSDAFLVLSGAWRAPTERFFLWIDELRPSELLRTLAPQLDPLTEQQSTAASWATSRSHDQPACRCEQQMPSRCDHVGSTAIVGVVSPTHIIVTNAGDSRAVLSRGGVPVALSVDHKPDRPDELARIEAAGGRVIYWDGARVLGVLAMSRAIGDGYLKSYVSSEPEVVVTERTGDDECLILANDGLWDIVSNEMACEVVRACFRSNGPPLPSAIRPIGVAPSVDADANNWSADSAPA